MRLSCISRSRRTSPFRLPSPILYLPMWELNLFENVRTNVWPWLHDSPLANSGAYGIIKDRSRLRSISIRKGTDKLLAVGPIRSDKSTVKADSREEGTRANGSSLQRKLRTDSLIGSNTANLCPRFSVNSRLDNHYCEQLLPYRIIYDTSS